MNIRRRLGSKKPIICILTLDDGSIVEISGKELLTQEMINPYKSTITSAELTENCRIIDSRAFYGSSLTTINIPNSVTEIKEEAFWACRSLTTVVIPDSVTTLGGGVFYMCENLTSAIISNNLTSIPNSTFARTILNSVIIPASVISIGVTAFNTKGTLNNITCLSTVAPSIKNDTFYNAKTRGTLTVPSGSSGYDVWMGNGNYYLGKYNWTKVEQ